MDRGNTKQEILEAALELFSVQGFAATSISQITNAVGIRKASLYSHFENLEVTESSSDLAEAGTTWVFPEKQGGA